MNAGARVAITFFFFADGFALGSWAARIPAVQHAAGLTNTQLGFALFAASGGALVAMPIAGRLCERVGSRSVTTVALLAECSFLVAAAFATGLAELAAALLGFGAAFGSINVAVNAQGIALERLAGRPILSSFHAAFSAGGLAGAGIGALAAAAGVAPRAHFVVLGLVLGAAGLALGRRLVAREADDRVRTPIFARPRRALLVLGAAAFCTLLAEGAAADWSAVYLSRSVGAAPAIAALGYTAFSLAMAASRTVGDRLNARVGATALVRGGGLVAAGGVGLALATASAPAALAGFAAMGAGLGVVVPVLFRAAGTMPGVSASAGVAAVSAIGWLGFLAGPPVIGVAAGALGLRAALVTVVAATAALAVLGRGAHARAGRVATAGTPVPARGA